jgi:hypothetical protein
MKKLLVLFAVSFGLCFFSCTTGVEESPEPGILRVTLKANEADSILVILGDTARCSRVDRYNVIVSRGRLYRGVNYVDLYLTPSIDRITADTINLIQRQWFDGRLVNDTDSFEIPRSQTRYIGYTVFEWYTPPGVYDKLQFALTGIEVFVAIPRQFNNPLQLPEGTSSVMDFPVPITVEEGKVTDVQFEIDQFKSIRRFRDSYIFDRVVRVKNIEIH